MRVIIIFTLFLSVSSNAWAFSCPDPGKPDQSVTFVEDANLNDIGYSYISSNGKAVISWNSTVANKMDPALAEFFKYHECAHIQDLYYSKGQIMKVYGPLKESRTDCLALLAMQSDGILTAIQIHKDCKRNQPVANN